MHKLLDQLVGEMVARGVHFEDAQREFEKRFLSLVLAKYDGSLSRTADAVGVHRNTIARKLKELKIKTHG